jgi:hypothetical protein
LRCNQIEWPITILWEEEYESVGFSDTDPEFPKLKQMYYCDIRLSWTFPEGEGTRD